MQQLCKWVCSRSVAKVGIGDRNATVPYMQKTFDLRRRFLSHGLSFIRSVVVCLTSHTVLCTHSDLCTGCPQHGLLLFVWRHTLFSVHTQICVPSVHSTVCCCLSDVTHCSLYTLRSVYRLSFSHILNQFNKDTAFWLLTTKFLPVAKLIYWPVNSSSIYCPLSNCWPIALLSLVL